MLTMPEADNRKLIWTVAVSDGGLMKSSLAGAPNAWLNAANNTDLPLPLSPVMTFNPGNKVICCSDIKAKFLHAE